MNKRCTEPCFSDPAQEIFSEAEVCGGDPWPESVPQEQGRDEVMEQGGGDGAGRR